jgi:hypothetical protein
MQANVMQKSGDGFVDEIIDNNCKKYIKQPNMK